MAEALIDGGARRQPAAARSSARSAQLERRGEDLRDEASRGRAYGFLVRRGYASELAYDAVQAAPRPGAADGRLAAGGPLAACGLAALGLSVAAIPLPTHTTDDYQ